MYKFISSYLLCLFLLTFPTSSQAQIEKASFSSKNDMRIIDESNQNINVSIEDIKTRLLTGKRVHFVKNQRENKRIIT